MALSVLDGSDGPGFIPLVLTLPCLLLGPVLMGVGARRAGLAGWLPLVLWVLGIGTFVATEFVLKAAEVAGIGVAAVALTLLGAALGRGDRAVLVQNSSAVPGSSRMQATSERKREPFSPSM